MFKRKTTYKVEDIKVPYVKVLIKDIDDNSFDDPNIIGWLMIEKGDSLSLFHLYGDGTYKIQTRLGVSYLMYFLHLHKTDSVEFIKVGRNGALI